MRVTLLGRQTREKGHTKHKTCMEGIQEVCSSVYQNLKTAEIKFTWTVIMLFQTVLNNLFHSNRPTFDPNQRMLESHAWLIQIEKWPKWKEM